MKTIGTMLVVVACALFAHEARAQVMNFTADPDELKQPETFRADRGAKQTFPAGSAVWMTLVVNADQRTIGNFAAGKLGATAADRPSVKVTVSLLNQHSEFDDLYSVTVPIAPADMNADHMVLPIIADTYDPSFPGFDHLMTRLEQHKKGVPLQVKVRVESKDPQFWSQNGFYFDESHGLGRFSAWLDQKHAALQKIDEAKIPARSAFVKNYRSLSSSGKLVADVHRWWVAHVPGSSLLSTKICSDQPIIVRDQLGVITERQACVLVAYKAGAKCFAMLRRVSYRRVGADTYENEVVDATYAEQHMAAEEGETFYGGQPYEIACSAAR